MSRLLRARLPLARRRRRHSTASAVGGTPFVCVDWGTTNFRAWLCQSDAKGGVGVLDRVNVDGGGILGVSDFDAALESHLTPLGEGATAAPVYIAGMAGSRKGWVEAPYVTLPASISALAQRCVVFTSREGRRVHMLPGTCMSLPADDFSGGMPTLADVMRGEETQVAGALGDELASATTQELRRTNSDMNSELNIVCLPGTHSKWCIVERGHEGYVNKSGEWHRAEPYLRLRSFKTFMTGEVFDLLRHHSSLSQVLADADSPAGRREHIPQGVPTHLEQQLFDRGMRLATEPGGILSHAFRLRAAGLQGLRFYADGVAEVQTVPGASLMWLLSGTLIGHEVRNAAAVMQDSLATAVNNPATRAHAGQRQQVTVVAAGPLQWGYRRAMESMGWEVRTVDGGEAVLRGIFLVKEQLDGAPPPLAAAPVEASAPAQPAAPEHATVLPSTTADDDGESEAGTVAGVQPPESAALPFGGSGWRGGYPRLFSCLADCPVVAILRGLEPERAAEVGRVLVDAGIRTLEVPFNSPEPLRSIAALVDAVGDEAMVGAGTVLDARQVRDVAATGAQLIVSPNVDLHVVDAAKTAGLCCLPGVVTPTEAFAALRAGADGLKLFPAVGLVGPEATEAMRAVLPAEVPLISVGGVGAGNLGALRAVGVAGFGVGGSLFKPGVSAAELRRRAEELVGAARELPPHSFPE